MAVVSSHRAPSVNMSDIPELLPGARRSATPAQREHFQQLSKELFDAEAAEDSQGAALTRWAPSTSGGCDGLEEMFPNLDSALVRTLYAEASSTSHAIEMLLALSSAATETVQDLAGVCGAGPATVAPQHADHSEFPCLVDGAGWQVCSTRLLDEEGTASLWRDLVKAAVTSPTPASGTHCAAAAGNADSAAQHRRREQRRVREAKQVSEATCFAEDFGPTDYELRHSAAQRRVERKGRYGRSKAGARPVADPCSGVTRVAACILDEESDEVEEISQ